MVLGPAAPALARPSARRASPTSACAGACSPLATGCVTRPGSLVVIVCADAKLRDRFAARVIDEQSAILSLDKVRGAAGGQVPADQVEEKAKALLDAAATKRFAAGQTVVIPLEGLGRGRARALRAARRRAPARPAPGARRGVQGRRRRGGPRDR